MKCEKHNGPRVWSRPWETSQPDYKASSETLKQKMCPSVIRLAPGGEADGVGQAFQPDLSDQRQGWGQPGKADLLPMPRN